MLVFLGGYFAIQGVEPSEKSGAINITSDPDYTGYKITGEVLSIGLSEVSIIGISVGLGFLASWAIKSPVPIGAGLFSGILAALYIRSATVINNITPQGNWVISGIIGIIGICIGILAAFTIIEYFAGQTGAD